MNDVSNFIVGKFGYRICEVIDWSTDFRILKLRVQTMLRKLLTDVID